MAQNNNLSAQREQNINKNEAIVLFVEFQFESKNIAKAKELLTEMQQQTLENEKGCTAYEMLHNDDEPNTIYLYESYEDDKALVAHNNASYFKRIVGDDLPQLIKDQKILKLNPVKT